MVLVLLLAIPLAASLAVLLRPGRRTAPAVTLSAAVAMVALSAWLAAQVLHSGKVTAVSGWLEADGLSALVILLGSFSLTTAVLFSWGVMNRTIKTDRRRRVLYGLFNVFAFSMVAIPIEARPELVWVAVELNSLSVVFLVGFDNTKDSLAAAWNFVVMLVLGAAIAMLGVLVLAWAQGSSGAAAFTWEGLRASVPSMSPVLVQTAFLLVLVGFGVKIGLVPSHTWVPEAYGEAPASVCALLSTAKNAVVLTAILRFFGLAEMVQGQFVGGFVVVAGLISIGAAAFLLVQVRDYKRLFAFSSIEQMGIILLAAGLGASASDFGAMYQLMTESLAKAFCFYAVGAVLWVTGTSSIPSVRGLMRQDGGAAAGLLIGSFAIVGSPPFAVFLSELTILKAGLEQGAYVAMGFLALFLGVVFFAIMGHVSATVFGQGNVEGVAVRRLPTAVPATLLLAGAPILILGLSLPGPLHSLLAAAATVLHGT